MVSPSITLPTLASSLLVCLVAWCMVSNSSPTPLPPPDPSLTAAPASESSAPSRCRPVDFRQKAKDLAQWNVLLDIAQVSGQFAKRLHTRFDPLQIRHKRIEAQSHLIAAGAVYQLSLEVDTVQVDGLSTIVPSDWRVDEAHVLAFGANFSDSIHVNGSIVLSIKQTNAGFWFNWLCWLGLIRCDQNSNAEVHTSFELQLENVSLSMQTLVVMMECASSISTGSFSNETASTGTFSSCNSLTLDSMIATVALQHGDLQPISTMLLHRLSQLLVQHLHVRFDQVSELRWRVVNPQSIPAALVNDALSLLTNLMKNQISTKRGFLYEEFVPLIERLLLNWLNDVIRTRLAPSFGSKC